ncbi:hypothetical protein IQ07DRAFT_597425 [Pyrenochaeta sp. DS3sAY3a]|nr:hypothetical protein IQ07DRAFT_597425 [Pyrenochaeta sp. DS3sAY3a]
MFHSRSVNHFHTLERLLYTSHSRSSFHIIISQMPTKDPSFYLFSIFYQIDNVTYEGLTTSEWLRSLCKGIEGWEVSEYAFEFDSLEELRERKAYYSTKMTDVMHFWCKFGPKVRVEKEGESVQAFLQVGFLMVPVLMGLIHHFNPKIRTHLQEGKKAAETDQEWVNQHAKWLNEELREIAEHEKWEERVQVKDIHNFGREEPTAAKELIGPNIAGDK